MFDDRRKPLGQSREGLLGTLCLTHVILGRLLAVRGTVLV
jgi:hypothetical protein